MSTNSVFSYMFLLYTLKLMFYNLSSITGDMGLLPSSTLDYCELSTSPYSKEGVNKMLHDWQQFINIEDVSSILNDL